MDLNRPLDLSRENVERDYSGTPAALIEQLRRQGLLLVLDDVEDADVAVEFPMGDLWREQTGCARFVRLRRSRDGKDHALVRAAKSRGGVRL